MELNFKKNKSKDLTVSTVRKLCEDIGMTIRVHGASEYFHRDLHDKNVLLTHRWQKFFIMISTTAPIEAMEVFRRHLEKHEIPEPEDLEQHLKRSTPCMCQKQVKMLHFTQFACKPMYLNTSRV